MTESVPETHWVLLLTFVMEILVRIIVLHGKILSVAQVDS